MNANLQRQLDDALFEVDSIEKWINKHPTDSNTNYLIKYSIIRSCGTIEVVFKNMLYEKLSLSSNADTKNFLAKKILDSSINPKTGNIEMLLQEINQLYKDKFQNELRNMLDKKSDLNSLVQHRNDFAHGYPISVTIATIKRYYLSGVDILYKLQEILDGTI